ncbi:hypothetical protein ODJ79_44730 [Actinoplanes sp. KI2]|uniref:hypothetical protein n=1 Tax=Actinoplanes sp. KI2 TaxID=2983315 RepID=UPI0021D60451|nr:hypothetical protein [Actinoplanes sp. KI2]MCU7730864.1 hypothetical protein [Actinoplanes sp. KI2]
MTDSTGLGNELRWTAMVLRVGPPHARGRRAVLTRRAQLGRHRLDAADGLHPNG